MLSGGEMVALAMRAGNRDAFLVVLLQLVAERADRAAEDVGGMGPVAQAMLQSVDDQVALHRGNGAADQRAGDAGRGRLGGGARGRGGGSRGLLLQGGDGD